MTVATTDIPTITMVLAKYWPERDRDVGKWTCFSFLFNTRGTFFLCSSERERERQNQPIRGTESEVAGIISATISMKTVRESRTVMPGGRRREPGKQIGGFEEEKGRRKNKSALSGTAWLLACSRRIPHTWRNTYLVLILSHRFS